MRMQLTRRSPSGYIVLAFFGTTLSLDLEGQVAVADGTCSYSRLEESSAPCHLPQAILRIGTQVFESPEQREKIQLPKTLPIHIRDEEW